MQTQFQEALDELDAFVKSREGKRRTFIQGEDGEPDPRVQLAACRKMLEKLEKEQDKNGLSVTEYLAMRSLAMKRIEELEQQLGDHSGMETLGKSIGIALAYGSRPANLSVSLASYYGNRISPEYLSWFVKNPLA